MTSHRTLTTCGYCSTGCNFEVLTGQDDQRVVRPNPDYPVNRGTSCPKGFLFLEPLKAEDRAKSPYLRDEGGQLVPVDWGTALQAFVENLKGIQRRYGRESVAFLSTGQIPMEEMALLGALAKFGMGVLHGDGNTRQCMATAATAYKKSFGFDAPPFTYADFEESDVLVFIGSNPVIAHPVMWNRVRNNPHHPEIVVIDPRKTETAEKASQHHRVNPGSLLTFLYGIAHVLNLNGWIDSAFIREHTSGFDLFQAHLEHFDPQTVSEQSGIDKDSLEKLARIIHEGERVSFWWTMGVNQNYQGVACAQAIINLALMTGNIGRPGTGANSITGQANAMGSRIFSNTTGLFAGYDFQDPGHRKKVADVLGMDVDRIPDRNSWSYDRILDGVETGHIRGLWIVCTNPAHSWINKNRFLKLLDKLEYLVVQDMYFTTETAQRADLVLAAAGCGEKEGIFINSERRLSVIRKVCDPPGGALTDFEIFKRIADHWGVGDLFAEWKSPAAVFEILKRLSKGRPCDISGIGDYEMIEQRGGVQWPYPEGAPRTGRERRLFEDGRFYHSDGRARFQVQEIEPVPEKTDLDYPFVLLTGRGSVAQWHTQTRTGKVDRLKALYPEKAYVEIHPDDASRLKISRNESVMVISRRGEARVQARIGDTVGRGVVFMPMHYPETNRLTYPAFDPFSREPSYKYAAVKIQRE